MDEKIEHQNKSNFMAIDLEMDQPSNDIIQLSFVIGNLDTGVILEKYCRHINIHKQINPYIIKLCGIKQSDIDGGISLEEIYQDICRFHDQYQCFRNPIVWGNGDSRLLRTQLGLDDEEFVFGRREIDTKVLYISYCLANHIKTQAGLARAMTKCGLRFQGRKHCSLDDAINTFIFYRFLLNKLKEVKNV